eukprot:g3748.t1
MAHRKASSAQKAAVPPHLLGGTVVKEGILEKLSSGPLSRWQERFFTLRAVADGAVLTYGDGKGAPVSAWYDLSGASVEPLDTAKKSQIHVRLPAAGTLLSLKAPSAGGAKVWHGHLVHCVGLTASVPNGLPWEAESVPDHITARDAETVRQRMQAMVRGDINDYYPSVLITYATGRRKGVDDEGTGPGMYYALWLAMMLQQHGVDCFSGLHVPAGCDWRVFIDKLGGRFSECTHLIVVQTDALYRSRPCLREIFTAIDKRRTILPVLFEKTPLLARRGKQWPDIKRSDRDGKQWLMEVQRVFGAYNSVPAPPSTAREQPTALLNAIEKIAINTSSAKRAVHSAAGPATIPAQASGSGGAAGSIPGTNAAPSQLFVLDGKHWEDRRCELVAADGILRLFAPEHGTLEPGKFDREIRFATHHVDVIEEVSHRDIVAFVRGRQQRRQSSILASGDANGSGGDAGIGASRDTASSDVSEQPHMLRLDVVGLLDPMFLAAPSADARAAWIAALRPLSELFAQHLVDHGTGSCPWYSVPCNAEGEPFLAVCGASSQLLRLLSEQDQLGGEPLNFITIFGRAREGKSTLMNMLAGVEDLFRVSHKDETCTRGVDLSAKFVSSEVFAESEVEGGSKSEVEGESAGVDAGGRVAAGSASRVGFVDVEGQGVEDVTYDALLVTPALLLSKVLIFNWKGAPQQDSILNLLGVLATAAQSVELPAEGGADEGSSSDGETQDENIFGHLHVVFRDWSFESDTAARSLLKTEKGAKKAIRERNGIRKQLKRVFTSVTIWTFPDPRESIDARVHSGALRPGFVQKLAELRTAIAAMNKEETLMPQGLFEQVAARKAKRVYDEYGAALAALEQELAARDKPEKENVLRALFDQRETVMREKAVAVLTTTTSVPPAQRESIEADLNPRRGDAWRRIQGTNKERLFEQKERLFEQEKHEWKQQRQQLETRARKASARARKASAQKHEALAALRTRVAELEQQLQQKMAQMGAASTGGGGPMLAAEAEALRAQLEEAKQARAKAEAEAKHEKDQAQHARGELERVQRDAEKAAAAFAQKEKAAAVAEVARVKADEELRQLRERTAVAAEKEATKARTRESELKAAREARKVAEAAARLAEQQREAEVREARAAAKRAESEVQQVAAARKAAEAQQAAELAEAKRALDAKLAEQAAQVGGAVQRKEEELAVLRERMAAAERQAAERAAQVEEAAQRAAAAREGEAARLEKAETAQRRAAEEVEAQRAAAAEAEAAAAARAKKEEAEAREQLAQTEARWDEAKRRAAAAKAEQARAAQEAAEAEQARRKAQEAAEAEQVRRKAGDAKRLMLVAEEEKEEAENKAAIKAEKEAQEDGDEDGDDDGDLDWTGLEDEQLQTALRVCGLAHLAEGENEEETLRAVVVELRERAKREFDVLTGKRRGQLDADAGGRPATSSEEEEEEDKEEEELGSGGVAALRQSIFGGGAGAKADGTRVSRYTATSERAKHLQCVNLLQSHGDVDAEEAERLREAIAAKPSDPFPVRALRGKDLSARLAELGAEVAGAGADGVDGGKGAYNASLWEVAQLCCANCMEIGCMIGGEHVCLHCGADMLGAEEEDSSAVAGGERKPPPLPPRDAQVAPPPLDMEKVPTFPYMGGDLSLSMYGTMRAYDYDAMEEVTQYVMLGQWGPEGRVDLSEYWLTAARYTEFREMHTKLHKRMMGVIPAHLQFPPFPKKLMELLATDSQLTHHMDEFIVFSAVRHRIDTIKKNVDMRLEEEALRETGGEKKVLPLVEDSMRRVQIAVNQ